MAGADSEAAAEEDSAAAEEDSAAEEAGAEEAAGAVVPQAARDRTNTMARARARNLVDFLIRTYAVAGN